MGLRTGAEDAGRVGLVLKVGCITRGKQKRVVSVSAKGETSSSDAPRTCSSSFRASTPRSRSPPADLSRTGKPPSGPTAALKLAARVVSEATELSRSERMMGAWASSCEEGEAVSWPILFHWLMSQLDARRPRSAVGPSGCRTKRTHGLSGCLLESMSSCLGRTGSPWHRGRESG